MATIKYATLTSNYAERLAGDPVDFYSERIGEASHTAALLNLRNTRERAGGLLKEARIAGSPTKPNVAFETSFSLHRDYKTRYANPSWLRRRGLIGGRRAGARAEFVTGLISGEVV